MSNKKNITYFLVELLIIFIGVTLAFGLQNYSNKVRDQNVSEKILTEIKNGLIQNKHDLKINVLGHNEGLKAIEFYHKLINDQEIKKDSVFKHFFYITRNFISIQNKTGYETLKSKGLELIQEDSIRKNIISLYDFDYEILEKLEESYSEMQFSDLFYHKIHDKLNPYYVFDENGNLSSIKTPLNLTYDDRTSLLQYLYRIKRNREYLIRFYSATIQKTEKLIKALEDYTAH